MTIHHITVSSYNSRLSKCIKIVLSFREDGSFTRHKPIPAYRQHDPYTIDGHGTYRDEMPCVPDSRADVLPSTQPENEHRHNSVYDDIRRRFNLCRVHGEDDAVLPFPGYGGIHQ